MAGRFSVEAVFKAVDRVTAPVSRMQNKIGKFTRSFQRGLRNIDRAASRVTSGIKKVTAGVLALGGTAAAAFGVTDALTAADVRAQQLSESIGANVADIKAISGAVAGAGFEFDHVIDLIEEMNNKLGESAGLEATRPVLESLGILGLKYKNIKQLAPEEQFRAITNAALKMEDAQKAASAADILMGSEANKIIGVLRQKGGTLDEIIGKYEALNVRTKESLDGSAAFQDQMNSARFAVSSIASEIGGLTGGVLAPFLKRLTSWLRANKEIVRSRITDFVDSLNRGVTYLVENFGDIVKWTKRIGVGLAVFISFVAILKSFIAVMTAVNIVMAMNPIGLIVLAVIALSAAIAAAIYWWDEIKVAMIDAARAVNERLASALEWLKEVFEGLPSPVKAAIMAITRPFRWMIKAADKIRENWGGIEAFFKGLWDDVVSHFESGWQKISGIIDQVKAAADMMPDPLAGVRGKALEFLGFGGDEEAASAGAGGAGGQMVSPGERVARSIEESRSTSISEVTIKDETGRAAVTGGKLGAGLKLQPSGAF